MSDHEASKPYLSSSTYDTFRNSALVYIPAIGALYFGLAQIWGLPFAEQIVGSLSALTVFLGVTVKISKSNFNKSGDAPELAGPPEGTVVITSHEDGDSLRFEPNTDLDELKAKDKITLAVVRKSA